MVFDGKRVPIERFVKATELNFDAKVHKTQFKSADGQPGVIYGIRSELGDIDITSLPDDRCNQNASTLATYGDEQYQVDLVFKSKDAATRATATRTLLESARQSGLDLQKLTDC